MMKTNAIIHGIHLSTHVESPTAVRNLAVTITASNSITIEWDPPLRTGEGFYYVVEYSNPDDISMYNRHTDNFTDPSNCNCYTVDNLRSYSSYIIRVSVHNHVSDQDEENADQRVMEVSQRTKEGRKICMCKWKTAIL